MEDYAEGPRILTRFEKYDEFVALQERILGFNPDREHNDADIRADAISREAFYRIVRSLLLSSCV